MRILYVEDNDIIREITTELLARDQREIVAVETAEDALKSFEKQHFDVVITDVSLPVMSGLDLARTILKIRPDASIIIASGFSLNLATEQWGPNVRAIVKPFGAEELDSLIGAICPSNVSPRTAG